MHVTVNAAAVAAHTHNRHFSMPEQSMSTYRSPATSLQKRARRRKRPSPMTVAPAMSTAKTMGNAPDDVEGTRKHVEALRANIMRWTSHFEYIWRSFRWLVACFTRRCQG